MSLHQLFCNNPAIADEKETIFKLEIDPSDRKHVKALRLEVGEHLAAIDASKDYFEVEIVEFRDGEPWVKIAQKLECPHETLPVYLVQGLAKGEKMDIVLRQATELGIAGFYPAIMQRSIVRLDEKKTTKRHERFRAIARNAALQSGRVSIPDVSPTEPLQNILDYWNENDLVLLFWEEAPLENSINQLFAMLNEQRAIADNARIWIVIGPEGGISPDEVDLIEQSKAQVYLLSLGPTILRTETAGVVSSALVINDLRFYMSSTKVAPE